MMGRSDRRKAWEDLVRSASPTCVFHPVETVEFPEPAQRLLNGALSSGVELASVVQLEMEGEIKLKAWIPFRARQVICAGNGFVWEATAGKPPLIFKGGDTYWEGSGSLDFRMWGIIPVARAVGADTNRSSAGRLAAETVAWLPQALTSQMGASWKPIDTDTATVTLSVADRTTDVTVAVDRRGRLQELVMQRWGDPHPGRFDLYPFGGAFESYTDFDGVTIPTAGRVGWWWGTDRQSDGEFFRYHITDAKFG